MAYYSAIIVITVLLMGVMIIHVLGSDMIDKRASRGFLVGFVMIILVSAAEWLGVALNGAAPEWRTLHALVKALEFSLSPFLICHFAFTLFSTQHVRWLYPVMIVNTVLEFSSAFLGFIFSVDAQNVYHRGEFYWIYMMFYVLSAVVLFHVAIRYSHKYQNPNFATLMATLGFLLVGVMFQIINSSVRTDWLTVSIVGVLFYIYYSELNLRMDALTHLLNRRSYERHLQHVDYRTAVIVLDVDDFKSINDNYGHAYGDVILQKVAECIRDTYGSAGLCFRTGGDEFCVILHKGRVSQPLPEETLNNIPADYLIHDIPQPTQMMRALNYQFDETLIRTRQLEPLLPELSIGYAYYEGTGSIADAIHAADSFMYQKKRRRKETKQALAVK